MQAKCSQSGALPTATDAIYRQLKLKEGCGIYMYIICMHAYVCILICEIFKIYATSFLISIQGSWLLGFSTSSLATSLQKAKLLYLCVSVVNVCLSDCVQSEILHFPM